MVLNVVLYRYRLAASTFWIFFLSFLSMTGCRVRLSPFFSEVAANVVVVDFLRDLIDETPDAGLQLSSESISGPGNGNKNSFLISSIMKWHLFKPIDNKYTFQKDASFGRNDLLFI
jgi:hypothetical protein